MATIRISSYIAYDCRLIKNAREVENAFFVNIYQNVFQIILYKNTTNLVTTKVYISYLRHRCRAIEFLRLCLQYI